jgi:hypothetical protein
MSTEFKSAASNEGTNEGHNTEGNNHYYPDENSQHPEGQGTDYTEAPQYIPGRDQYGEYADGYGMDSTAEEIVDALGQILHVGEGYPTITPADVPVLSEAELGGLIPPGTDSASTPPLDREKIARWEAEAAVAHTPSEADSDLAGEALQLLDGPLYEDRLFGYPEPETPEEW